MPSTGDNTSYPKPSLEGVDAKQPMPYTRGDTPEPKASTEGKGLNKPMPSEKPLFYHTLPPYSGPSPPDCNPLVSSDLKHPATPRSLHIPGSPDDPG